MTSTDDTRSGWRAEFTSTYSENTLDPRGSITDANAEVGRITSRLEPGCAVLEIACGEGGVLACLADAGYRCTGVELDKLAANRADERLGERGTVIAGDAMSVLPRMPSATYDVVLALNFFEHLNTQQCSDLLQHIHRVLKPAGRLIGLVPNGLSPFAGRSRYWDLTHVTAFTPASLQQLARYRHFELTGTWERGPIVHGLTSCVRAALWWCVRTALRLRIAIEMGEVGRVPYTLDMFFEFRRLSEEKPRDDCA